MSAEKLSDGSDPVLKDAVKFLQLVGGGIPGMVEGSEYAFDTGAERMRIAYSEAWQRLHDFLFDETPGQRQLAPRERVITMFSRFFYAEDTALTSYAGYGFGGFWEKFDDHMFAKILFENQPEDRYLDHQTYLNLHEIFDQRDSDNGIDSRELASFVMYYAATVQLTRTLLPPGPSPEEAMKGLVGILDKDFSDA